MPNTSGKYNPFDMKQLKWALQNSGGSGAGSIFGAMTGMPWQQKRGGQWMTIDPRRQSIYPSGTTPYGRGGAATPTTGGEDPAYDPNDPNSPLPGDKFKKNLIPEWWKQWYRTQGQFGGMPPVDGLL
jgi:hypothetical protein